MAYTPHRARVNGGTYVIVLALYFVAIVIINNIKRYYQHWSSVAE